MEHPEPAQRSPSHGSGNAGSDWLAAMRAGDFAAAFRASDQVLAARDLRESDQPGIPYHERWIWDGTDPTGRDVLVRCYHGLGDTVQFCRFLPALGRVAASVTLEVQPELMDLLRDTGGVDRLHPFDPARPLPRGSCDVEIMELAHMLRQVPDPAPYLRAHPARAIGRRIGLCWQGGDWDEARSVPAAMLEPVLRLPGLHPVSLQRGPAAGALALEDPLNGSMDVATMARLLAGLDAVVTVDTMVAHLAGALGRPVFLLLKRDPDWRWGADGVWYGSVKPYRQCHTGDWSVPIASIAADLAGTPAGDERFVAA